MAEKDQVYKEKIKQAGLFDFKEFYSFVYDLLNGQEYDISEKKYSEKIVGEAKEIEIKWEATRRISDYFKFMIKLDWFITGMRKVKVKREGKEIEMNSGSVEINFKAILVKDYENRWEGEPFWKFLRGIYDRYVIRSRIEDYEEKLIIEVTEAISQCKSFLAIEAQY
jgi:hypothetical protein